MPSPHALLNYVLRHMVVTTLMCTRQKHERGYSMAERVIHDYNFIYVIRGRPVWVVEQTEYPLEPGGLVIVPPDVKHHAYCRTEQVTLGSLHVLATLPGGQDIFKLLAPPPYQEIKADSPFDIYFRGFMAEFDRNDAEFQPLQYPGWAHLITRELFRDNASRGLLASHASDPLVAAMLEDLNRRLSERVKLSELSRRSGFSAQHLNRVFQRELGVTPLQYLARARLEKAASLLREGSLSVAQIARQVGYDDPFYFSRQFTAHHGQSPSAFRDHAAPVE